MKHKSHKSSGFSLLEIMVALVVLSTSLIALMALQGSLNKSAIRSKAQTARISSLLNIIVESLQFDWVGQKKNSVTQDKDDERVKLEYKVQPLAKNSSLGDLKQLKRIECSAASQYGTMRGSDMLVFFVYVNPEDEKKKG